MTDVDACEDCDCGVEDEEVAVGAVEVPTTLDLSTFMRNYLEQFDGIEESDEVVKVVVCSEKTVAYTADG